MGIFYQYYDLVSKKILKNDFHDELNKLRLIYYRINGSCRVKVIYGNQEMIYFLCFSLWKLNLKTFIAITIKFIIV